MSLELRISRSIIPQGTTEDLSSALTYASLDIQPSGAVIREIDSEENDTEDEVSNYDNIFSLSIFLMVHCTYNVQ